MRELVTARPRNEWPDDGFQTEDVGADEHQDTMEREREEYYGRGEQWEPDTLTNPRTPGRDGVPTIDDNLDLDVHAAPRVYPSWTSDNSFVVSGTVGPEGRWQTRAEGRKWAKQKYGFIFEEMTVPGKAFFRVPKPKAK